ncbi:MAG: glycosyltransferase [Myxococcales bacterium]|nr:glycosyltransferase [Myxococcales bacterium]
MKMSIVTASLNQGPFIRDCIESVRRQQSAVAWEHIIADGGSTDETLAILESYEHLSWKSEPDEGQSDAFNKGQHQASGDWIIWLNADDFLMPGALDAFAAAATRDPSADGFYSDYYYVDAEGRVLKRRRPVRFNPSMVTYIGPYVPTSGSVYHRRIFESGILLDKNFRICMDRDFLAHLGSHGFRLEHVRGYFSAFREHGDNVHLQSVQGDVERRERMKRKAAAEHELIEQRYGLRLGHSSVVRRATRAALAAYFRAYYRAEKLVRGMYADAVVDRLGGGRVGSSTLWMRD